MLRRVIGGGSGCRFRGTLSGTLGDGTLGGETLGGSGVGRSGDVGDGGDVGTGIGISVGDDLRELGGKSDYGRNLSTSCRASPFFCKARKVGSPASKEGQMVDGGVFRI